MKTTFAVISTLLVLAAAAPSPQVDGNQLGSCQNKRQGETCQYVNEYGHSVSGTCSTYSGSQSNGVNPVVAGALRCNPPVEDGSVFVGSPDGSASSS